MPGTFPVKKVLYIQPWSLLGALALLMSAPVVVIFLLFQHTLLEQMLFGSVDA